MSDEFGQKSPPCKSKTHDISTEIEDEHYFYVISGAPNDYPFYFRWETGIFTIFSILLTPCVRVEALALGIPPDTQSTRGLDRSVEGRRLLAVGESQRSLAGSRISKKCFPKHPGIFMIKIPILFCGFLTHFQLFYRCFCAVFYRRISSTAGSQPRGSCCRP